MSEIALTISLLPGTYAVSRLGSEARLPRWATSGRFFSVTRTADELSVVCDERAIPGEITREGGWRCLKVLGPLDFGLTGILASLTAPLAEASISIFAISTYETDYIMVKAVDLERAVAVLSGSGHQISQ
jgi:hypothetical protein